GQSVGLQVLKVNPARSLYKRLGFLTTGQTATHYLMRATPEQQTRPNQPRAADGKKRRGLQNERESPSRTGITELGYALNSKREKSQHYRASGLAAVGFCVTSRRKVLVLSPRARVHQSTI